MDAFANRVGLFVAGTALALASGCHRAEPAEAPPATPHPLHPRYVGLPFPPHVDGWVVFEGPDPNATTQRPSPAEIDEVEEALVGGWKELDDASLSDFVRQYRAVVRNGRRVIHVFGLELGAVNQRGMLWNAEWRRVPLEDETDCRSIHAFCADYDPKAHDFVSARVGGWVSPCTRAFYRACNPGGQAQCVPASAANRSSWELVAQLCIADLDHPPRLLRSTYGWSGLETGRLALDAAFAYQQLEDFPRATAVLEKLVRVSSSEVRDALNASDPEALVGRVGGLPEAYTRLATIALARFDYAAAADAYERGARDEHMPVDARKRWIVEAVRLQSMRGDRSGTARARAFAKHLPFALDERESIAREARSLDATETTLATPLSAPLDPATLSTLGP